jgi:hypothetical protein
MPHTEFSFISKSSLNLEWGVQPPGNNRDAIPEDATAKAIFTLTPYII